MITEGYIMYLLCSSSSRLSKSFKVLFFPFFFFKYRKEFVWRRSFTSLPRLLGFKCQEVADWWLGTRRHVIRHAATRAVWLTFVTATTESFNLPPVFTGNVSGPPLSTSNSSSMRDYIGRVYFIYIYLLSRLFGSPQRVSNFSRTETSSSSFFRSSSF